MKNKKIAGFIATLLGISVTGTALAEGFLTPYISNEVQTVTNTEAVDYIEEFAETAPEISEMNLKIKAFDEISDGDAKNAVAVLYAKNLIGEPDIEAINANKAMSVDEFSQVLKTSLHLDTEVWEKPEKLTRLEAARMLGAGCEHYRKRYIPNDSQKKSVKNGYADVKDFSDEDIIDIYNVIRGEYLNFRDNLFGVNDSLSLKEGYCMIYKMLHETDLLALGKGAEVDWTEYETEYCDSTGENIISTNFVDNFAFEALGRTVTKLSSPGQYIKCKNVPESNHVLIRYSLENPNYTSSIKRDVNGYTLSSGSDYRAKIGIYVNGEKKQNVEMSSYVMFGQVDTTAGANGYRKKYYVFATLPEFLLNEGDTFEIRVDEESSGVGYYIDSVFFEKAPAPIEKPEGYLDITDFGAVADDRHDDTMAIVNCLRAAMGAGCGVYIPKGNFLMTEMVFLQDNVKIQGAGMHHTTLECNRHTPTYWQFGGRGSFGIAGNNIEVRNLRFYNTASVTRNGSQGNAIAITGRGGKYNIIVDSCIMENTDCGMWLGANEGTVIKNNRVYHTFADALHIENTGSNMLMENNYVIGAGDDAFASCSDKYEDARICKNNIIRNNTARGNYWGRGIMGSGTYDCLIENNVVLDNCHGAGILVWTEAHYVSASAKRVTVKDNIVSRCGGDGSGSTVGAVVLNQTNSTAGMYADGDFYDNEIYETLNAPSYKVADVNGRIYSELVNNLIEEPKNPSYNWFMRQGTNSQTHDVQKNNYIITR